MLSQEEFDFIEQNIKEDPRSLALKTHGKFTDSMGFLLNQIKLKQKSRKKLPTWSENPKLLFPSNLSYEQCSSEVSADFKSTLISGKNLLDMSGGIGIDSIALSTVFNQVTHLEYNQEVQRYCAYNFNVLGKNNISSICADSISFLNSSLEKWDAIYIDPDRRPNAERTSDLEDCLPNIIEHLDLLLEKSQQILIKASPMCNINSSIEKLKYVTHTWVVSHKNECKEVLFLLDKNINQEIKITATELETPSLDTFKLCNEDEKKTKSEIKTYLYDPYVSYRKANLSNKLALNFNLNPIAQEGTILTSETFNENFPGRIFKVEQLIEFDRKKVAKSGIKKANVISRGFHLKADEIASKLKIKDGGNAFLIAWLSRENKAYLAQCERLK